MNKVKKNFIYLSLYKILEMLLPMITSPLLSRRLGAEALGIYSYSYSIVSIFAIISQLGVYNYGMREIAKVRHNKEKLNNTYTNIFFTHLISGITVTIIYFISLCFMQEKNIIIFLIQGGVLLSNIVDNAFLFIGLENVKTVSLRDAIIKFATFFLILIFIKSPNDLLKYTMIMTFSTLICRTVGLLYGRKFAKFVKPKLSECKKHFKPMLILMIPTLASTVYQSMDKIMIGWFYGDKEVGYYECASKGLIPKNIITALGTVMCPHIAGMYAENKKKEAINMVEKSLTVSLIMAYIFAFGIIAIAKEFAPWFWGSDFSVCSNMLIGLSITIPIWCIGEVIRNQLLLPLGRDNQYMISFVLGIIANAILNALLIPKFAVMGAIIATIFAELVMSISQVFFAKKEINIVRCIKLTIPYLIISIIMLAIVRISAFVISISSTLQVLLEVGIGVFTFTCLTLLYETLSNKKILINLIIKRGKKE